MGHYNVEKFVKEKNIFLNQVVCLINYCAQVNRQVHSLGQVKCKQIRFHEANNATIYLSTSNQVQVKTAVTQQ